MRTFVIFLCLFASVCIRARGQEQPAAAAKAGADAVHAAQESVQVYAPGGDTTAPELVPLPEPPFTPVSCKKSERTRGEIAISTIVNDRGVPRNVYFLRPIGNDLDLMALRLVSLDRFHPGLRAGVPAAVAVSVIVTLDVCAVQKKAEDGTKKRILRLHAQPEQKLGAPEDVPSSAALVQGPPQTQESKKTASPASESNGEVPLPEEAKPFKAGTGVTAPRLVFSADAEYTDEARRAHINGTCLLSLIVDAYGMPQHIQVVRSLGHGLDENAVAALRRYRFKPALRNGTPVAVMLNVVVNFRLT
ncbi:MAG: TonB family protein [Terracidiphilus sp.]